MHTSLDGQQHGGALTGIRVLELGRLVAAPTCGQILGDLGADVVKVERAGKGDEYRSYGPHFLADPAGGPSMESSAWISANRNKRGIALNFADPADLEVLRQLAARCDVFIENFKAGGLRRFGLDYASVAAVNPDVIYLSVTGFGQDGPYAQRPGTDGVCQALSGLQNVTGEPDRPSQKVGVTVVDLVSGLNAAISVLAALRAREVRGKGGQQIDAALMDSALWLVAHKAIDFRISGQVPYRTGNAVAGAAPSFTYVAADGEIFIQAAWDDHFQRFCQAIDRPDLAADPRFSAWRDRDENQKELNALLQEEIGRYNIADLVARLEAAQILHAPVQTVAQALDDPHVRFRANEVRQSHPWGEVTTIASPHRLSRTPPTYRRAPPLLGQDNAEVLADWLGPLNPQGVVTEKLANGGGR